MSAARPFGCLAARLPIVPGLGVHARLGSHHRKQKILRIFVGQRRHGIGKGGVELRPLRRRIVGVARRHCGNQGLLLLSRARRERLGARGGGKRRSVGLADPSAH